MMIINFEKKKMIPLTNEEQESLIGHNMLHLQKQFKCKYTYGKKYCKFRDYCHYMGKYRGVAGNLCNLKYIISKEITLVFYSDY